MIYGKQRDYYEKLYISQVKHTNNLLEDNNYLKEENQKLSDWVFNILKEFGTCNVHEERVNIPVLKKVDEVYFWGERKQEIHIPEIIIRKEY